MWLVMALGMWFLMLIIAVCSGAVREKWLVPVLGEQRAHQVGTLLVCGVFVAAITAFMRVQPPMSMRQASLLGLAWMCLTIAFEAGFFHYAAGKPWSALLADYRVDKGRLWPLVLLTLLITPILAR